MGEQDRLNRLVAGILHSVVKKAQEFQKYEPHRKAGELSDYTVVFSDDEERRLTAILTELGDQHPFRGDWEVACFIIDRSIERLKQGPSNDVVAELVPTIAKELRQPLRTYSFSAPISMRSPVGYNMPLGGARNLRINSTETPASGYHHMVIGDTKACTTHGAIEDAEQSVREVLGAAIASGLAVLTLRMPGESAQLPIIVSPNPTEETFNMEPHLATVASHILFIAPASLSEIETARMKKGDTSGAIGRIGRHFEKLFATSSERGEEVRNGARLYLAGHSALDYGTAVTYFFMCLEALLLERATKENIQARLAEAVAYRIGTSAENRAELRSQVKRMYDDRSTYVHTGRVREKIGMREACTEMVRRVLQKEIEDL